MNFTTDSGAGAAGSGNLLTQILDVGLIIRDRSIFCYGKQTKMQEFNQEIRIFRILPPEGPDLQREWATPFPSQLMHSDTQHFRRSAAIGCRQTTTNVYRATLC